MNEITSSIYANSVIPKPEVRPEIHCRLIKKGTSHEEIMARIRQIIKEEEAEEKQVKSNPIQNEKLSKKERKQRNRRKKRKQRKDKAAKRRQKISTQSL